MNAGQRFGDYVVESFLGEGGMAVVARGKHVIDGTIVALKILTEDKRADHPGLLDRFHREAKVLEGLKHIPSVVGFMGTFHDPEHRADVMVLEFVDGRPLSTLLGAPDFDVEQALELMGHACHALHDMHEAGFVHRDLKPDNLMLVDDPDRPIRLIDFNSAGASSAESGRLTQAQGTFPHTPAYLAPECFDGLPADKSADVYALGITFAELMLGHHPLVAAGAAEPETNSEWHAAHEDHPFPDLHALDPQVPVGLQDVLRDATAKRRRTRIPDAVVLWTRLRGVWDNLNTEQLPTPASRPSLMVDPVEQAPPPKKRSLIGRLVRFTAMIAALLALIACAGLGAMQIQGMFQVQAAELAELKEAQARAQRLELERDRLEGILEEERQAAKIREKEKLAGAPKPTTNTDEAAPVVPQPAPRPRPSTKGPNSVRPSTGPRPQPRPQPQPQPQPRPVTPRPVPPPPPPTRPVPRPTPRPTYPRPRPQPRPTVPRPRPRPRPTTTPRPTPRPRPTSPVPRPRPRPTSPVPRPRPTSPTPRPRPVTPIPSPSRPLPTTK